MMALTHCELGRMEEAQRVFHRLCENDFSALPKDNEWLFNLTLLAEVANTLGDQKQGDTLYRLLEPYKDLVALAASEASFGPVS